MEENIMNSTGSNTLTDKLRTIDTELSRVQEKIESIDRQISLETDEEKVEELFILLSQARINRDDMYSLRTRLRIQLK